MLDTVRVIFLGDDSSVLSERKIDAGEVQFEGSDHYDWALPEPLGCVTFKVEGSVDKDGQYPSRRSLWGDEDHDLVVKRRNESLALDEECGLLALEELMSKDEDAGSLFLKSLTV